MSFTPKADLLFKDGPDPKQHCIAASFVETADYGFVSVSEVQDHPEDSNGYLVTYVVGGNSRGGDEMDADLGIIPLVSSVHFVDVEFYDEQSHFLGKKRVRAEEAQKDTRPIEESER